MNKPNMIVVAVDVGTTQISAVMGLISNNVCNPIGTAYSTRTGVKRGVVIDKEETAFGIREAINMLQNKTGHMVGKVYIALGGRSLKTIDEEFTLENICTNITNEHIAKLNSPNYETKVSANDVIKKIYPQTYLIDGYNETPNPSGYFANSLTAKNKLLVFNKNAINSLKQSISKARLLSNIDQVSVLVLSDLLLSDIEKEKGVALVDLGGGTTDLIIYHQKQVRHVISIPLGGQLITQDIASELKISFETAEKLKLEYGRATACNPEEDHDITFEEPNNTHQTIKLSRLTYIIQCRVDEILSILSDQISISGCRDRIQEGVVLTGRASLLKGTIEVLEKQQSLKARHANHPQLEEMNNKCSSLALAMLTKVDSDCSLTEATPEPEKIAPKSTNTDTMHKGENSGGLFSGIERLAKKVFRDPNDNDDLK